MISWVFVNEESLYDFVRKSHTNYLLEYRDMIFLRYAHPIELKWRFEIRHKNGGDLVWEYETSSNRIWDVVMKVQAWVVSQYEETDFDNIRSAIYRRENSYRFFHSNGMYVVRFTDGNEDDPRYYAAAPDNYFVHIGKIIPDENCPEDERFKTLFDGLTILHQWNNWTSVVIQK